VDFAALAALARAQGADTPLAERIRGANTAMEALELCAAQDVPLADAVAAHCRKVARGVLRPMTTVDVLIVDRSGVVVGHAGS
jgi:cobalt-precorrin-5B (C1)-methyltransferase